MKRLLVALVILLLASPASAGVAYLGDFPTSGVVYCPWSTNDQTGASITRSTDGTLKIFKDNSVTERTSLAGVTQNEDFDSATGVHWITVDTSDNTDSGFYAAGHEYSLVMAGMTIDTKTVNAPICSFSIQRSGGALAVALARLPNATPGAAGGVFIAGTNAPVTITGSGTALTLTSTGGNGAGLAVTGNGSGAGASFAAGATGKGVSISTTAGDGLSITPTAGNAIVATANGTSKHGAVITGGTAGTSDGLKLVAGTGGVDMRANITGSLSGSVGSVSATSGGVTLMGIDALVKNSVSVVYNIVIRDSTTGAGLTGLAYSDSGLLISYARADQGNADAATCTPAAATRGSFTSCGLIEKDATNQPGVYEFGIPNASIASGADLVVFYFSGVSGMIPTELPIALVDAGLVAINNKLGTPVGASVSADIAAVQTSATAIKGKTDSLTFTGSDLGAIVNNYASGKAPVQPTVAGRTLDVSSTGGAGVDWANVKAPTTTVGLTGTTISTSQAITSVSGSVGSVTGAAGSVTGAVGSVTGAVGSVTGNVGGNVTGSVGSISGITFPTNFSATKISAAGGVQASTYQKNVASQTGFYLFFYSAGTPGTAVTGLGSTWTMQVSKDGGAFAAAGGTKSEIGGGIYYFAPSQADTNCNVGLFSASGTDVAPGAVRDFITTR